MHRDQLFDITMRWLNNEPKSDDGVRLTEIFLFESAVTAPTVQDIMTEVFADLYGGELSVQRVQHKDRYRSMLVDGIPRMNERLTKLVKAYRKSPEEFFPGMPVDAILMFTRAPHDTGNTTDRNNEHNGEINSTNNCETTREQLVAMSRIKRTSRVAEKASYRLTDALAGRVRREAEVFAAQRAKDLGVPLNNLVSTQEQMDQDFVAAERVVANEFRDGRFVFHKKQLTINDIIGFKIVGEPKQLAEAEQVIGQRSGIRIIEREEHRGHYNATNLLVEIELPAVEQIIDDNAHRDWHQAARLGLDPLQATKEFSAFVESGARSVCTEVILTTYPELIESELGRSLHELRILRLRERQNYAGQIAQNARYLIEYLFAVAYSPTTQVNSLPIKMWGRYLPDTVLTAVGQLFGAPQQGLLRWFLPD